MPWYIYQKSLVWRIFAIWDYCAPQAPTALQMQGRSTIRSCHPIRKADEKKGLKSRVFQVCEFEKKGSKQQSSLWLWNLRTWKLDLQFLLFMFVQFLLFILILTIETSQVSGNCYFIIQLAAYMRLKAFSVFL